MHGWYDAHLQTWLVALRLALQKKPKKLRELNLPLTNVSGTPALGDRSASDDNPTSFVTHDSETPGPPAERS
jgi:hypothetical protein